MVFNSQCTQNTCIYNANGQRSQKFPDLGKKSPDALTKDETPKLWKKIPSSGKTGQWSTYICGQVTLDAEFRPLSIKATDLAIFTRQYCYESTIKTLVSNTTS